MIQTPLKAFHLRLGPIVVAEDSLGLEIRVELSRYYSNVE